MVNSPTKNLSSINNIGDKNVFLLPLIVLLISVYSIIGVSQVTSVNYQIKYNQDSCWYDAFIIINAGSATTSLQRTQDFSKFSIIVPTGTLIDVSRNYFPLLDNADYNGNLPNNWNIYAVIGAPAINPSSDYYIFAPSLDDPSYYNDLNTGDTIRLFSFFVDTIFNCGQGIRIFENGIDPGPNQPGMGYINFNNTFRLMSGTNIYNANSLSERPPAPLIYDTTTSCNAGIEINISSSSTNCQLPINYQWFGPGNYVSTVEDVFINPASFTNSGLYKVIAIDSYGCKDSLNINAFNKPSAGNDMVICANSSVQLNGLDPSTGIWLPFSGNNPGASLQNLNDGVATASFNQIASGIYKFIYSASTCSDTMEVNVFPLPSVSFVGEDSICVGQGAQLTPSTGGYWISNDLSVATITSSGFVTSIAQGKVNFTFNQISSGCASNSDSLIVNPIPVVSVIGTSEVCIGSTTNLLPNTSGNWTSSNPLMATIDNAGLVTGITVGGSQFIYTSNVTGCSSLPEYIAVKSIPVIDILGPNTICQNAICQLMPNTIGVWESIVPSIASVSSNGLVTGLAPGIANFRFTETATGCTSALSDNVTVVAATTLTMSANNICSGNFAYLSANASGIWSSSDPAIATILPNSGLVTGISPGKVIFTFVRSSDFCNTISDTLTVIPSPVISAGTTELCVGSTTELNSTTGGIWSSLDEDVVTISGNTAIGINQGFVSIRFTETLSGCENILLIHVSARPQVSISESDDICVGLTTQLSPSSGGIWSSSNSNIAAVDNAGIVTGISAGSATFIFTETSTGCNSQVTNPVTVKALPVTTISGPDSICIGTNTAFLSTGPGFWLSNNPSIAQINFSSGEVTGITSGNTSFTFTQISSGCTSLPSVPITVKSRPNISFSGSPILCAGENSQLNFLTGGNWTSNAPSVAIVDNSGTITSINAGNVTFTFTQTGPGCNYTETSEILTVVNCFNPDFNVTPNNIMVSGNLSTNDKDPQFNLYNNSFMVVSGPAGSSPQMNINPNGSYTFEADVEGIYTIEVPVCILPNVTNCPSSTLVITVKNEFLPKKTVSANTDLVSTAFNTPVVIQTLENDACILVGGCVLDPSGMSIISPPVIGSANINTQNGEITYTPTTGISGRVQLTYKVCVLGEPLNCDTAIQIITILEQGADNNLTLSDDLHIGNKRSIITGNVLVNDLDPEGNIMTVLSQNVTNSAGTFILNADGSFSFSPILTFTGPVNFVYEVCDNNINSVCKKGTLYLLVLSELGVNIRVYLEGALLNNSNATAGGRPLMRDNLRMSPFNGNRYIPNADPYKFPTTFVNVVSKYVHKYPGNKAEFATIADPTTVFSVSGRDAIVDWVFIELRSKNNKSEVKATRSALLQRDGDVVDIDGISALRFPETVIDSYYVAVRHRNHLGAMTSTPQSPDQLNDVVNFTSPTTPLFDFGTSKNNGYNYAGMAQKSTVKSGYMALWAGDIDANKKIKTQSPNDDLNFLLIEVLFYPTNLTGNSNFNSAFGYLQGDYDLNSKSKFDNPNDDKNMMYAQLLFYPLNTALLQNFNFFIEQLP